MKTYDKIHGITYKLNVEDSAHSLNKKLNLPSKQQEESIKEGNVIPLHLEQKVKLCPRHQPLGRAGDNPRETRYF